MWDFIIQIYGVPPDNVADKLWSEIERFKVNFLVLDKTCYIYGNAGDQTLSLILLKACRLGFRLELERG